jgi:YHS domain-containing protein
MIERMSTKILDPICDMVVEVETARDQGLTIERPEREYAFCSHGCLVKFAKSPQSYIAKVDAWLAAGSSDPQAHQHPSGSATPVIDAGMRDWYRSCRCCLSEAHPEVVKMLDAEKEQTASH